MDGTFLGKIRTVKFGFDSDDRFGLTLGLSGDGIGVEEWIGLPSKIPIDDVNQLLSKFTLRIMTILKEAKCQDIHELKDKPVEMTLEGNMLKKWRILTEVL